MGGKRLEDYPKESSEWYVVVAEGASDVGITGGGVVDGQGLEFVVRKDEKKNVMVSWNQTGACLGDECRPRLVGFLRCNNIRIWNVTFSEPAYWWCVTYFRIINLLILQFTMHCQIFYFVEMLFTWSMCYFYFHILLP